MCLVSLLHHTSWMWVILEQADDRLDDISVLCCCYTHVNRSVMISVDLSDFRASSSVVEDVAGQVLHVPLEV